jgi:hypothetical protein
MRTDSEKNKGTQFDPEIADVMLRLIKNGEIRIDDDPEENK